MTLDLLPPFPTSATTDKCGICEGIKVPDEHDFMWCPHCDSACKSGGNCGICKAGTKGLPDRE
jgi:hypothetical protein